MDRKVTRKRRIPSFRMQLGDLEALIEKLKSHFAEKEKVSTSISVDLPNEKLGFKSVDEMREYERLPDRLTKFTISLAAASLTSLESIVYIWPFSREIHSEGPSEAWCAAIVEEGAAHIRSFRVWYSWLRTSVESPWGWLLVFSVPWPLTLGILGGAAPGRTKVAVVAALSAVCILWGTMLFRPDRMLPVGTLVVRDRGTWLRNHIPELTLLFMFLTLLVAVIALFVH
jgi:hypothetical protein